MNAQPSAELGFQPFPWTLHPQLPTLAALSKEEFQALTAGSPIPRPKYEGFRRNVQIGLRLEFYFGFIFFRKIEHFSM